MDINQKITEELGVKLWQVEAAVKLIEREIQFHYCQISKRSNRNAG